MLDIVITSIVFLVFIILGYWGYTSERKEWGKGISPAGEKWKQFDTDSQGGRGYTTNKGEYCWISWPGIDR